MKSIAATHMSVSVRVSGSVKPSPPSSRESAQCVLDVINLEQEPVKEGKVEESEKEDKNAGCTVQGVRHGAKQQMDEKMSWAHNST